MIKKLFSFFSFTLLVAQVGIFLWVLKLVLWVMRLSGAERAQDVMVLFPFAIFSGPLILVALVLLIVFFFLKKSGKYVATKLQTILILSSIALPIISAIVFNIILFETAR